VRINKYIATIE